MKIEIDDLKRKLESKTLQNDELQLQVNFKETRSVTKPLLLESVRKIEVTYIFPRT